MEVIGIQLDIAWEDRGSNLTRVEALVEGAEISNGSLIVLPEMFASGFSMNVDAVAEPKGGDTEQFLSSMAKKYGAYVVGGVVTPGDGGKGRNEAVAFDGDGVEAARYCKRHPFSYGGEADRYQAGDAIVTFECGGFKVCPFICYDLRFPECFRSAVRRGADVFVVIANWPAARESHWLALLRARAIENQAYVVAVNRCGSDANHQYSGRSQVIDPLGEAIADAGSDEGVMRIRLDAELPARCRRDFPALDDMRTD